MEDDGVSEAGVGLPLVPGDIEYDVAELDEDVAVEEEPAPVEPVNILVGQT